MGAEPRTIVSCAHFEHIVTLSRLEKTLESRLLKTLEILVHTLQMIVNKLHIICVSRSVNTLEIFVNTLQNFNV